MVDIDKIEKRTVRSFYEDGLTEIALGLIFLLLGAYFYAEATLPPGSTVLTVVSSAAFLAVFAAAFLVNRLLRYLKRRITYPRTGYVTFKKKEAGPKRRLAAAAVAMVIGGGMAVLYGLSPSVRLLLPAVNGLLFAVAGLLVANRIGVGRFYVLAAASAAIGVGLTAAGAGDAKGVSLFYLLFGAAVILTGAAALAVYLRRNPRPADDTPDAPEGPDAR
jgi:MFS family permease